VIRIERMANSGHIRGDAQADVKRSCAYRQMLRHDDHDQRDPANQVKPGNRRNDPAEAVEEHRAEPRPCRRVSTAG
jgi:hypothetical protein